MSLADPLLFRKQILAKQELVVNTARQFVREILNHALQPQDLLHEILRTCKLGKIFKDISVGPLKYDEMMLCFWRALYVVHEMQDFELFNYFVLSLSYCNHIWRSSI